MPEDGSYGCLLQPNEEHDNQHERATDRIWSKATYKLREVESSPGNWVMYYLADGLERAFVKEELMLIPEDTELPPILYRNGENILASKNGISSCRTIRGEQGSA